MQIYIKSDSSHKLDGYINGKFIKMLRAYLLSHIDKRQLYVYQDVFNVDDFLYTLCTKRCFRCRKFRYDYIIDIDPNIYMHNSFAKLDDICRTINYGNSSSPAYPIFTQMFQYFQKNFNIFYKYSSCISGR